jgi:hypothetical protein
MSVTPETDRPTVTVLGQLMRTVRDHPGFTGTAPEAACLLDDITAAIEARVRARAGEPVEWGVEDSIGRVTVCPSRAEAEAWLDDVDAWNPGEPRWLTARPTRGWSRVERES